MNSGARVRAVLLDLGGTLLRVRTSVGEVYAETAARFGFPVSAEDVARNFKRAWKRGLERGSARNYRCSDSILKEEWLQIVRDSFDSQVPPTHIEAVFEELYRYFATGGAWVLAPGVTESLAHLRSRNLRLVLLSNWDSRSVTMLRDLGLHDLFDSLVISYDVGVEKPHPEIFREALRRAGADAAEALHVGDSLEADIRPARSLGIRTLWLDPDGLRQGPDGVGPTVASFSDLGTDGWDALLDGQSLPPERSH